MGEMPAEYVEAIEYAKAYRGSFEFMVEMRKAADTGRSFSQGMVTAILRCKAREVVRLQEQAVAAAEADQDPLDLTPMPKGTAHFAVDDENGKLVFLRVDNVQDGGWIGWIFVKEQHSETYDRVGKQRPDGLYVGSRRQELRSVLVNPLEAAVRYGRALGKCGICGTTLTDEKSRELGIGPVCRKRFAA